MPDQLKTKIIEHLQSKRYQPQQPRRLADAMALNHDETHAFRDALRELMHAGRVVLGAGGAVLLAAQSPTSDEFVGVYRGNPRGFGFVVPTDPASREDLFIPPGDQAGALTGDVVRAKITNRGQRDGKAMYSGRVTEIIERTNTRFVGTLVREGQQWLVHPDGNTFTQAIDVPDAASRHVPPGAKVVVELTTYPAVGASGPTLAQGVITEVLGAAGEKDVDLRGVIVQFNLPGEFPAPALAEARRASASFDPQRETASRVDLSDQIICTIDPDDAKDYDDAISLRRLEDGRWELGVHIADVSHFIPAAGPLDVEARARGNSAYFPGFVIPMLPEVLSNGVCSLQEGVPRLCKSAFIEYDAHAQPVRTRFANTIIRSAKRLRYTEAQALIERRPEIPHPEGKRRLSDYPENVLDLLADMNALAKRIQARRHAAGQIVLELPEVHLVLDDNGRVIDAVPEDTSFTHTLIEMFMVEANEAAARLLNSLGVAFLRRAHPEPELKDAQKLRNFAEMTGYHLPKQLTRKGLQSLLESVRGKPESFAMNLAVLKSLTRAEYSPEHIGHYALASEEYCHFTSPIRRYADLTIHRLLDSYLRQRDAGHTRKKMDFSDAPDFDAAVELGRHLSFTERRAEDAERELRKVKVLTLLQDHIGEEFAGVVTGITNFGIFVQVQRWLVDGLIRYEDLMDDWWDVDERSGCVRGQRTGRRIGLGDVMKVITVRVDLARRELVLAVREHLGRRTSTPAPAKPKPAQPKHKSRNDRAPGKNRRGRRR